MSRLWYTLTLGAYFGLLGVLTLWFAWLGAFLLRR